MYFYTYFSFVYIFPLRSIGSVRGVKHEGGAPRFGKRPSLYTVIEHYFKEIVKFVIGEGLYERKKLLQLSDAW